LFCNTASGNTGIGNYALRNTTTGLFNTAVGDSALICNDIGRANIALGWGTMSSSTNNRYNIAIGNSAGFNLYSSCIDYIIAVGDNAVTSAVTGHTVWGNACNNVCNCVYAAWSNVSDCRDKANVKTLGSKYGLALIKKLRPVAFNWDHREAYVRECKYTYGEKDGTLAGEKEHYGLIAQELKSALDELDVKFDGLGHDDEKDAYRLTYEELIAPLIKAVQELNDRLEIVEEKIG
jgi:hypothetical protein